MKKSDHQKKQAQKQREDSDQGKVRLNKFLANAGIASRREADDLIKAGLVTINGKIVSEMGIKVAPTDDVRFNGRRLNSEQKTYILMNKPKDFITTANDPQNRRTVLDLIKRKVSTRVYPVGRLDRNTTGVLMLTNDGELSKRLTHPKYNKKKIYHVTIDKPFSGEDMKKVAAGIDLNDGFIKADNIEYPEPKDKKQVGIEIHSGRNRIVRRIFEHLGYKVIKLDRVYFAGLTKKNLSRGQWRFLSQKEINMLKMNAFE
jgi:23S rRNA pseudouridine2605 synthase